MKFGAAIYMPLKFTPFDLTFTVAGKGIVNNAGDLKLDAADGFLIAPQKGIKFGDLGASAKAIDFSGSGIGGSGYSLYFDDSNYWKGSNKLYVTEARFNYLYVTGGVASINKIHQSANIAEPFKTTKCTITVVAPGAGYGVWRFEPGTNAGTAKIVAYAGTSTAGTVIQDNIGAGF